MKILHLIYDDMNNPWLAGGGALQTLAVSKLLASKGHEITVVTGNYIKAVRQESIGGVLYKRVGCGRSYFLSRLTYSICAQRMIRSADYDILVDDFSAFSPTFSPLFTKKPVVAVIRNFFGTHAFKKYKLYGLPAYLVERVGIRVYSNFITIARSIDNQLRVIASDRRIKLIPDFVDESLLTLEQFEDKYILFIGRIDIYQKGLDVLLESLRILGRDDFKLVVAGGGKDLKRLEDMISKHGLKGQVVFKGYVRGSEKEELFSKCLFLCMPSRFEAFGDVAIEAAACGKAIIGANIPGLSETILEEKTGILVEPGDAEALAEAMLRLLDDVPLRKKLGLAGREWARNFSLEKTARLTEEFLLECISNK